MFSVLELAATAALNTSWFSPSRDPCHPLPAEEKYYKYRRENPAPTGMPPSTPSQMADCPMVSPVCCRHKA
jgi:hypothetical protein